jgi:histidine triad (HIT) family protein
MIDNNCLFCKIIKGEIPCFKVYEDEYAVAFLDIKPSSYGHTLVLPKNHVVNVEEASEEDLARTWAAIKKVGKSLKDNLGIKGYNIYENNDPIAGQVIPHLHFHVIPRYDGDGLKLWAQRDLEMGEGEKIVAKVKIN